MINYLSQFKCKTYKFIFSLNTRYVSFYLYLQNVINIARHCRRLDPKMARLECQRSSSSFLSSRVQPGVLSCMADIDMCTRVFESKPSTEKRPFLPLWESMFLRLLASPLPSHSFPERKFVHEKSGKLDGAIASTVADERSSNERSAGIP